MTFDELLRSLDDRDVKLYLDGDRLRYRAHRGALTPDLRSDIAAHRAAIIDHLRTRPAATTVSPPRTNCDWRNWVDAPPQGGRIRTTCGKCQRFIGYRPLDPRVT